jgi:hypothetical protein
VSLESVFLEMMPSTVTLYAYSSMDAYGKPTYSASGTQIRCRIMDNLRVGRSSDYFDTDYTGTIIFYGTPTINELTRIVMPNGDEPQIVSIRNHIDEEGSHHTTVTYT